MRSVCNIHHTPLHQTSSSTPDRGGCWSTTLRPTTTLAMLAVHPLPSEEGIAALMATAKFSYTAQDADEVCLQGYLARKKRHPPLRPQ
jgi:hypothetical protein